MHIVFLDRRRTRLVSELNKEKDFNLAHCFRKLQLCEKWRKLRNTLNKDGPSDVGDGKMSDGRPTGTKKAKASLAAAANSARTAASIEKVIADVSKSATERRAANDARWVTLMDKTNKKLELEKAKAASKKRREDFMVLTADVSALDAQAKAACEPLRAAIFQEMAPATHSDTHGHGHGDTHGHGHGDTLWHGHGDTLWRYPRPR